MATFASLTPEQKVDIAAYDRFLRGMATALAKVGKESDAGKWNQFAKANVDAVIATLDAGAVIPNSTSYDGAKPLAKEEFLGLQAILRGLESTRETNLPLMVKAIGINS